MITSKQIYPLLPDDHMVLLYREDQEVVDMVVKYVIAKLEKNHRCLYITCDIDAEAVISDLKLKIDYDYYLNKRQLIILPSSDIYAEGGTFVPNQMIELLIAESNKALAEGFAGLAITGELSWVLNYEDGFSKIMEYEWKLNDQVFASHPVSAVCRYSLNKFSDEMIINIIQVHPFIVWQGKVHENPFYVPVGGYKHEQLNKYKLEAWLENITRFTNVKSDFQAELMNIGQELIESEEKYRFIFENSSVGRAITLKTGETHVNNTLCRMLGYSELEFDHEKWENYTHPDDIELSHKHINQLLNGEVQKTTYIKRYIRKDGSLIWVNIHAALRRDFSGHPLYFLSTIIDITERVEIEQELFKQHAEQRYILDQLQTGILLMDTHREIIYANHFAEAILETSLDQMLGSGVDNRPWVLTDETGKTIPPREFPIGRVIKEKKPITKYLIGLKTSHNADLKWLETSGFPIFNEDQEIIRVLISLNDVTENRQNVAAIRANEAKQQALVSNISDVIAILDKACKVVYMSGNITKYFGWEQAEMLHADFRTKIAAEDLDQVTAAFEHCRSAEGFSFEMEYQLLCQDGSYKWVQMTAKNLFDDSVINGCLINFKDITEKKKIEQDYEKIIKSTTDGFMIFDDEETIIDINDAYCQLLGYSRDEILGMKLADIKFDEDIAQVKKRVELLLDKGYLKFETVNKCKSGQAIDVELSISYLKENNKFYVFVRNLSEEKRLERERLQFEAQMRNQQKLESIGTLASGIAHEINNPINGVMNYGQILMDISEEGSDAWNFAKEILGETNRVATIVKNLLDFSHQSSTGFSLARVEDIILQTLSLINTVMKHDQITLEIEVADNLPDIECRSQQIRQVIMNLLTNARDSLNQKYPEYDDNKRIIISAKEIIQGGKDFVQISVKDYGDGIPVEIQDNILDPFFTTKPRDKGTGLGLSISYGIIQEHSGDLAFKTVPGEFTEFYITLPLKQQLTGW